MYLLAQLLLTIATVGYSLVPVLADFNATHVTNPTWDPHARFHIVWQVSSYVGVAAIGLYLIWFGPADGHRLLLASAFAVCMYGGFFTAVCTRRWYGGTLYSENGILPIRLTFRARHINADANVAVFASIVAVIVVPALVLLAWMM